LLFTLSCGHKARFIAINGSLDLKEWNHASNSLIPLKGEWLFYRNQLLDLTEAENLNTPSEKIIVPSSWNLGQKNSKNSFGYATYRLKIWLPKDLIGKRLYFHSMYQGTSCHYFVNGELIASQGVPATSKNLYVPTRQSVQFEYFAKTAELDLLLHIANFDAVRGGLRETIQLSTRRQTQETSDAFLLGIISLAMVFHFFLWIYRRSSKAELAFVVFCGIIFVRQGFTGDRLLQQFLGIENYRLVTAVEYISFFFLIPSFFSFFYAIFPKLKNRFWMYFVFFTSAGFTLSQLIVSNYLAGVILPIYQMIFVLLIILVLVQVSIAVKRRYSNARTLFWGIFLSILASLNDILYSREIISTGYVSVSTAVFLTLCMSVILARQSALTIKTLEKTQVSIRRFLPESFLKLLGKVDINDIALGDQTEKEMTIVFTDIRNFTALSERLTPKENFDFLNSYLKRMGPIIRAHNGFIDKYIGDGIMALFPESPTDAVRACIEMLKELEFYNQHREKQNYSKIAIGMGIHFGYLMLGLVGEEERLDGTVVSDSVNIASRLESLTKTYHCSIIASDDVRTRVADDSIRFTELGSVEVKGKGKPVSIYRVE